ncbi:MAG: type 2 lanthipeptide synthetase LanM [Holophagales bacterium]|nr:type 2 lanthipeptide synthetase LanM [Holophagales bacterium]
MAGYPAPALTVPPAVMADMAARAANLRERLSAAGEPPGSGNAPGGVSPPALALRWRRALGAEDEQRLERRLAWDGVGGPVDLSPAPVEEPGWARATQRLVAASPSVAEELAASPSGRIRPFQSRSHSVAFEHLLIPFVDEGRHQLETRWGPASARYAPAARADVQRGLLQTLSLIAAPSLSLEFALYRAQRGSFPWGGQSPGRSLYLRFVDRLLRGELVAFLAEYAVLARLIGEWTSAWARAQAEVAMRLSEDWAAVAPRLGLGARPCRIERAAAYRSDPHDGGRTVVELHLAGNRRLVYKPRGLGLEAAYGRLLAWVGERGFSQPLRRPWTLDRGDYGWMEHIPARPARRQEEITEFHRRLGGHLCLLGLLGGTDFHAENLVASGGQPVWVDCETLVQPRLPGRGRKLLGPGAGGALEDEAGLGATGVLPSLRGAVAERGSAVDFSVLGRGLDRDNPIRVPAFESVNQDDMTLESRAYRFDSGARVPRSADRAVDLEALLSGYREMFALVLRHRRALLASGGPLSWLERARGRFVARGTHTYGQLLQRSWQPEVLRDGVERSLVFELLRRDALSSRRRPAVWALVGEELDCLERMDIPRFETGVDADGPGLVSGPASLWPPPLAAVRRRVEALDERDLDTHVATIRRRLGAADVASSPRS